MQLLLFEVDSTVSSIVESKKYKRIENQEIVEDSRSLVAFDIVYVYVSVALKNLKSASGNKADSSFPISNNMFQKL